MSLLDFMQDSDKEALAVNDPRQEWFDMPEFHQDKEQAFHQITVRFGSQEDLEEFAKMIGQKLTPKTKAIWHPELDRGKNAGLRWVDEE